MSVLTGRSASCALEQCLAGWRRCCIWKGCRIATGESEGETEFIRTLPGTAGKASAQEDDEQ
ncbi:MAG: hypothetical protein VX733_02660 [Candidatus Latescibacterota bacterium]|nr:hypothetical protein [Candidatus Latescibacterota bacterium]